MEQDCKQQLKIVPGGGRKMYHPVVKNSPYKQGGQSLFLFAI